MKRRFLLGLFAASLHAQSLDLFDKYGGAKQQPCPAGPAPHFYTAKINNRWWFCTPDGNAFWMHSVWAVSPAYFSKYGSQADFTSAARAPVFLRRLKNWNFNATDAYSSRYMATSANTQIQPSNAMPAILGEALRPSFYGLENDGNRVDQPLKAIDVIDWQPGGTSQRGANHRIQDPFDANYKLYLLHMLKNYAAVSHAFTGDPEKTKYIIGFMVDDTDWAMGLGAGPDFRTSVDGAAGNDWKRHQHIGLLTLDAPPTVGAYARSPAAESGILYGDPRSTTVTCKDANEPYAPGSATAKPSDTICAKFALQRMLQGKYQTIGALNAAWGSSYTTWGSTGSAVSDQLLATTNGTNTVTATLPGISAGSQITPFSVRVYLNGVYIAGDTRYIDNHSVFSCDGTATSGYLWGQTLQGTFTSNVCPNPINYTTGAITIKFDTAPPAGQQVRVDYVINGWGRGTGFMDENGTGSWLPQFVAGSDTSSLSTAPAAVKADLDDYLYRYAYRYFKDVRDAIDEVTPGCNRAIQGTCYLYLGPSYLGTWGSPAFRQVIQAASTVVDVYPYYTIPTYLADGQARVDFVRTYFGDKPIISWEGFTGGSDSPFPIDGGNQVRPKDDTQAARGARYKQAIKDMLSTRYSVDGTYPVIGTRWWDWGGSSSTGELMNWGLVTPNDDPLDGFCPGPGTRSELVPGGPPVLSVAVSADGKTAIVTTRVNTAGTYHAVNVGARVRIMGATVNTALNGEYPVVAIAQHSFTIGGLSNVMASSMFNESTLKIEYVKYPCGGSNEVCMVCSSGANRYLAADPRRSSDPDGPYNNRFGDFLSHVREANGYWLDLIPRPRTAALE